jgi:hypothetical protein
MDPRIQIRIHTKMSWIRNTVKNPKHATLALCTLFIFEHLVFCSMSTHNNLGAAALQGQQRGGRPPCQRPFSFAPGIVPELEFSEALGMQLGTVFFFFSLTFYVFFLWKG